MTRRGLLARLCVVVLAFGGAGLTIDGPDASVAPLAGGWSAPVSVLSRLASAASYEAAPRSERRRAERDS